MNSVLLKVVSNVVLSLLFLLIAFSLNAQGYKIDAYNVTIKIRPDGVAEVQELIDVDFNEKRRGIIRTVPLNYKNAAASEGRAILMNNVNVKGDPFVVLDKGVRQSIRIGSPSKYVRGDKSYDISYEILGAVEQFGNAAEFSWNIIGDEWDTAIKKVRAEILLPFAIQDEKEDIRFFINQKPASAEYIKLRDDGKKITITYDKRLKGHHGMTMALRFKDHRFPLQKVPAAVLSDLFYIPKMSTEITISENGELEVQENKVVRFLEDRSYIERRIPSIPSQSDRFGNVYSELDRMIGTVNGEPKTVTAYRHENLYNITQSIDAKKGKGYDVSLTYNSHGNVSVQNGEGRLAFNLLGHSKKALVDTVELQINSPFKVDQVPELEGYKRTYADMANYTYTFVREDALRSDITLSLPLRGVDENSLYYPPQTRFANRRMDRIDIVADCRGGSCDVEETIYVETKVLSDRPEFFIAHHLSNGFPVSIDRKNFLKRRVDLNVKELAFDKLDDNVYRYKYRVNNVFAGDDLILPIYRLQAADDASVDVQLAYNGEESTYSFTADDATSNIKYANNYLLKLPAASMVASNRSVVSRIKGLFGDNIPFWLSILIATILHVLWRRYGRDKVYDGSMQSMPPNYLTPAEAGYLWDGQLHGRDLISLIYHWAARGLLSIEEEGEGKKKDYILYKEQELPEDALDYEKTVFAGLFYGQSKTRVSSLRTSFYSTMRKAQRELKKTFEKRHLYEPNTRGVGILFVVIGFLVFAGGLVLLGMHAGAGNYSWSLPTLIVGMAMLAFGYYLPKKTALGSDYFIALQKFKRFMDEAPPEELVALYEKDSAYFQNTLAFAIVLGKAKKWAKRFAPILKQPPSYYRGADSQGFSSVLFTDHVLSSMHTMERDFYSQPAPEPSSGSYSGGRSSSFGGGGFSGGFGGGGGSSW